MTPMLTVRMNLEAITAYAILVSVEMDLFV